MGLPQEAPLLGFSDSALQWGLPADWGEEPLTLPSLAIRQVQQPTNQDFINNVKTQSLQGKCGIFLID